jgi:ATP synthase protein I
MSEQIDRWGDEADDLPFKQLTREEARTLREQQPPLSPWRVLAAQAAAGLFCVLLAWGMTWRGEVAASALYGALATVIPNALLARGLSRRSPNAVTAAAGFLFWEMVKIGVAVAMLVAAPKVVPQLSWPALLVAMLVCIKVNWLALLWRRKPRMN